MINVTVYVRNKRAQNMAKEEHKQRKCTSGPSENVSDKPLYIIYNIIFFSGLQNVLDTCKEMNI